MNALLWLFGFIFISSHHLSRAQDGGLDALRKNIRGEPGKDYPTFGSNILCKINPTNPGCGGGGRSGGGGNGGGNGGRKKNNNGQGGRRAGSTQNRSSTAKASKAPKAPKASKTPKTPRAQNGRPRKTQRLPRQKPSSNDDLLAEIAAGNIPGTAGKDYPVNSLAAWRKRPGYENIELAPADLVVAGYPFPSGGGGGARGGKRKTSTAEKGAGSSGSSPGGGGGYCAGGALQNCIGFCPSDDDGQEYGKCVSDCGKQCPT